MVSRLTETLFSGDPFPHLGGTRGETPTPRGRTGKELSGGAYVVRVWQNLQNIYLGKKVLRELGSEGLI